MNHYGEHVFISIIRKSVTAAVPYLQRGDVVGVPTETIYELADNIFDAGAIRKIYKVKKRPLEHPLIVRCKDVEQVTSLCLRTFPVLSQKLAAAFWPGPLTMILPKRKEVSNAIQGEVIMLGCGRG